MLVGIRRLATWSGHTRAGRGLSAVVLWMGWQTSAGQVEVIYAGSNGGTATPKTSILAGASPSVNGTVDSGDSLYGGAAGEFDSSATRYARRVLAHLAAMAARRQVRAAAQPEASRGGGGGATQTGTKRRRWRWRGVVLGLYDSRTT